MERSGATTNEPTRSGPAFPEAVHRTVTSARVQVRRTAVVMLLVVAASLLYNVWSDGKHAEKLAWTTARSISDVVVAMRGWVAKQDGVYAPVSERVPPNPLLDVPDRDIRDEQGRRLTKVNPAYLTRLVAANLPARTGIRIRLVSDRPLRPTNRGSGSGW